MRFDCGETWEEEKARKSQWRRWFAWYPVSVAEHDCRWLEFVLRRSVYTYHRLGHSWDHEFKAIKTTKC